MECARIRLVLSARIDGEASVAESGAADAHLSTCVSCAEWETAAQRLNRAVRVRPAAVTPDLTAAIMAASRPSDPVLASGPPRGRTPGARRLLLGLVAAAQLGTGLVELVPAGGHVMAGEAHLFNESTAWNLALGIGFGVAAVRPRWAAGLLPTVGVFVALLGAFSILDILAGRTDLARVATHAAAAAGLVLLWLVHREHRRGPGRAAQRLGTDVVSADPMPDLAVRPRRSSRRGLRPAGRHVA